jgi:hypothetical protein
MLADCSFGEIRMRDSGCIRFLVFFRCGKRIAESADPPARTDVLMSRVVSIADSMTRRAKHRPIGNGKSW